MKSFEIDEATYNEILQLLNNQHFTGKPGSEKEMEFLSDDWWLRDTAVVEKIVKRDGMWEIQLVFALYGNPLKFIKRNIDRHTSYSKAEIYARYMRRLAAKDQRGTLEININNFNLCSS